MQTPIFSFKIMCICFHSVPTTTPSTVAIANCKEMRYTTHGKRYFAVAFGNESGGYEIRNPFFFMDYLSARALGIGGKEDHLVLNSVSNVARAYRQLDGYGRIKCYLDNDEAGRRTLGALFARYGGRVSNCSGIYDGCKDLNEHLQRALAERQAQSENEKKNKSIRL